MKKFHVHQIRTVLQVFDKIGTGKAFCWCVLLAFFPQKESAFKSFFLLEGLKAIFIIAIELQEHLPRFTS